MLRSLYTSGAEKIMPPYVNLRYYVLVHDEDKDELSFHPGTTSSQLVGVEGDGVQCSCIYFCVRTRAKSCTRSNALFYQMKKHFGLQCHLLHLRSGRTVVTGDDAAPAVALCS